MTDIDLIKFIKEVMFLVAIVFNTSIEKTFGAGILQVQAK